MKCPRDATELDEVTRESVQYRRCGACGGSWLPNDKLRVLKDTAADGDYRWIDIDLWKDREEFHSGTQQQLVCPNDAGVMVTVDYGESDVHVDICGTCQGIWLDADEFAKITAYLEQRVNSETVAGYVDELRDEFVDIFTNPKHAGSEASSFFKVLHLLELRFGVEHKNIAGLLGSAGRGIPGV